MICRYPGDEGKFVFTAVLAEVVIEEEAVAGNKYRSGLMGLCQCSWKGTVVRYDGETGRRSALQPDFWCSYDTGVEQSRLAP